MTDDTNLQNDSTTPSEEPNTPSQLTNEELNKRQAELQAYRKALEEELTIKAKDGPDGNLQNTLEFFKKQLPSAAARIAHLAEYATSDATRFSANKYMIEVVRRGYVDDPTDPVNDILKLLQANDNKAVEQAEQAEPTESLGGYGTEFNF